MSRRNENWLLIEWAGGEHEVVSINMVLNPVGKDLKNGDLLTVSRRGTPHPAKLISSAKERDQLKLVMDQLKLTEEGASNSPKPDEEPMDFGSSSSSWTPNGDERLSDDSDHESRKNIKLEHISRQYINRRSSKKVLIPSHRANAVIPQMFQNSKRNELSRKRIELRPNRKRTHNAMSRNESCNKSLPDSTKKHNTSEVGKHMVTIDGRELAEITNSFRTLFKMVEELKKTMTNNPQTPTQNNAVENILPVNGIEDNTQTRQEQETCEEIDHYDIEEEFNRSDDNVLITNKYENQCNESVVRIQKKGKIVRREKTPNKPEDEWVPIGSGKTLIHIDQFRKVNWKSYTVATRSLLLAVFPRRVLATHSLTGRPSPAFMTRPAKMCLDPKIISDVIIEIMDSFDIKENLVRGIITTKCADECKMWKQRVNKKRKSRQTRSPHNDENVPVNNITDVQEN